VAAVLAQQVGAHSANEIEEFSSLKARNVSSRGCWNWAGCQDIINILSTHYRQLASWVTAPITSHQ